MARARWAAFLEYKDAATGAVKPIVSGTVTVYEDGTTNLIAATMYDADSGGSPLPNPFTVDADDGGLAEFFLDVPQRVKVVIVVTGVGTITLDHEVVAADPSREPLALALTGVSGTAVAAGEAGVQLEPVARKNLLDNGAFLVADMGATPVPTPTDNLHFCTPWRFLQEAANAAAVTIDSADTPTDGSPFAAKLVVGSGEDNKFGIGQILPFSRVKALRTPVSLQAKLKATAGIGDVRMAPIEWVGTADNGGTTFPDPINGGGNWDSAANLPALTTNWHYLGVPVNLNVTTQWATYVLENLIVGAATNNLAVLIWCQDKTTTVTTDILRITDVQLEEGSICTAFERQEESEVQADLDWLFQRFQGTGTDNVLSQAHAYGTDACFFRLPFRRRMRKAPSFAVGANSDLIAVKADISATGNGTPSAFATVGRDAFVVNIASISGSPLAVGSVFVRWASVNAYISADARL